MTVANGTRTLKVGLMLPLIAEPTAVPRWSMVSDMARVAEDIGIDSVWVVDHLIYQLEGEPDPRGCWEAWTFLSALAAITHRVELGTLVLAMGWRNPALLAKMADSLEEVSDGRLILGLGAGYHQLEFDQFGFPYDHRIGRFEEAIQIVTGLLRDGEVDVDGRFHSARECILSPRGPRPEGPPVMIGTNIGSRRMQGITARYADSWNVFYDNTANRVTGFERAKADFDEALSEEGRDPATIDATVTVLVADSSADPWWDRLPSDNFAEDGPLRPLMGEPEEIAAELLRYETAGCSHIQISLDPSGVAPVEALAPVVEALDALSS